jgi:hypothetical protein
MLRLKLNNTKPQLLQPNTGYHLNYHGILIIKMTAKKHKITGNKSTATMHKTQQLETRPSI